MPQIYDMGPMALLPLRRKACWGFFCPKNPMASARTEPANLGTKGQHTTPRPPKPIIRYTDSKMILACLFNNGKFTEKSTGTGSKMCVCCTFLYKQWPEHFQKTNSRSMKKHIQVFKYRKHYFHSILTKNGIVTHIKLHKNVSLSVILLYCYLHSLRYQQIQLIYWLMVIIPKLHTLE